MVNPFIDPDTRQISDEVSLRDHEEIANSISKQIKKLQETISSHLDFEYLEDDFRDYLEEFLEELECNTLMSIEPLTTMVNDALTYEDYLADMAHERTEGVSYVSKGLTRRNSPFFPNGILLRKERKDK